MRKTWSVSRGPIAATPADVEKASAINAMLCEPIGILPKAPGDPIRPFSLGLFNHIKTRLKPEFGVSALRRATAFYIFSKRYYFASAQPDSMPVAPLTAADRAAAQKSFIEVKRSLEERRDGAVGRTRPKEDGDGRRPKAGDLARRL